MSRRLTFGEKREGGNISRQEKETNESKKKKTENVANTRLGSFEWADYGAPMISKQQQQQQQMQRHSIQRQPFKRNKWAHEA